MFMSPICPHIVRNYEIRNTWHLPCVGIPPKRERAENRAFALLERVLPGVFLLEIFRYFHGLFYIFERFWAQFGHIGRSLCSYRRFLFFGGNIYIYWGCIRAFSPKTTGCCYVIVTWMTFYRGNFIISLRKCNILGKKSRKYAGNRGVSLYNLHNSDFCLYKEMRGQTFKLLVGAWFIVGVWFIKPIFCWNNLSLFPDPF